MGYQKIILIIGGLAAVTLLSLAFISINKRPVNEKILLGLEGANCHQGEECQSGVCNYYKGDLGECAKVECIPGEHTNNNDFFCNEKQKWSSSRQPGESCSNSYECFEQTCFMDPSCDLRPPSKAACENNVCVIKAGVDQCAAQGMKKVLRKNQYSMAKDFATGQEICMESMAQMVLPTVCAPCGNGVCDTEVESKCNCSEECKE